MTVEVDTVGRPGEAPEARREAPSARVSLEAVGARPALQDFLQTLEENARGVPTKTPEGLCVISEDLDYGAAVQRLYDFATNGGNHPCCSITLIGPNATSPARVELELPKRSVQMERGAERVQAIITIEGKRSEPVHFRVEFKYQREDSLPHIANAIETLRRHHIL